RRGSSGSRPTTMCPWIETPRKPRPPVKAQCPLTTTAMRRSTTAAMCAVATRRRTRTPARKHRTEHPPRRGCLLQARSLAGRLRTVHDARTPWTQLCASEGIWQGRNMTTRAGQLAQDQDLVDIPALLDSYHRSEEHTSELQSRFDIVCRLLL